VKDAVVASLDTAGVGVMAEQVTAEVLATGISGSIVQVTIVEAAGGPTAEDITAAAVQPTFVESMAEELGMLVEFEETPTTVKVIVSPSQCQGDPAAFDAGFGTCDTYLKGHYMQNFNYCDQDYVEIGSSKLYASAVCCECQKCGVCPSEETSSGGVCQNDRTTWDAGWGLCPTYADENKPFCLSDKKGDLFASQVCFECGACATPKSATAGELQQAPPPPPPPPLPKCEGDSEAFDASWGPCSSYTPSDPSKNSLYCDHDKDKGLKSLVTGEPLSAAEVCPECLKCDAVPQPTSQPAPAPESR